MAKVRLEKFDTHLKEKLKDKEFRKFFELERANVALAQRIAELRQNEGLKQTDLAKKMHVSQQFISQIETAQERNLTIETLLKIAKSLGHSVKISFPEVSPKEASSYLKVS